MSITFTDTPGATGAESESGDDGPCIDPEDVYWQLVRSTGRICQWCMRWQVPRHEIAAGPVEVAGVTAEVDPSEVAEVEHDHPPRVPRPAGAHRSQSSHDDTPLDRYRACQPEQRICECGDVDSDPYQTLSKEKAQSLVPRLARRIGEFGYVYSLDVLHEEIKMGKSDPDLSGDDDKVFELAVAVAIVDARGGDVEEIREEVLDD